MNYTINKYEENGELLGTITLNVCMQALHDFNPYGAVENFQ